MRKIATVPTNEQREKNVNTIFLTNQIRQRQYGLKLARLLSLVHVVTECVDFRIIWNSAKSVENHTNALQIHGYLRGDAWRMNLTMRLYIFLLAIGLLKHNVAKVFCLTCLVLNASLQRIFSYQKCIHMLFASTANQANSARQHYLRRNIRWNNESCEASERRSKMVFQRR